MREHRANFDAVLLIRKEKRNNERTNDMVHSLLRLLRARGYLFPITAVRYRAGGNAETILRGAGVTAEMSSIVYHSPRYE